MKLSLRILFINFVIVLLILGSSAVAIITTMQRVLNTQRAQNIQNSASNFSYVYSNISQKSDYEFAALIESDLNAFMLRGNLLNAENDFIIELSSNGTERINRLVHSPSVNLPKGELTLKQFLEYNPYAIIKSFKDKQGKQFYYGRILTQERLDDIALRINADIALVWDNTVAEVSGRKSNENILYDLNKAVGYFNQQSENKIYFEASAADDVTATLASPFSAGELSNDLSFLIFKTNPELTQIREALKVMFLIIGLAGLFLSVLLTYIFTNKMRSQITDLSNATKVVSEGDFNRRISVRTKDEIGQLGKAFNLMLDELQKNQKAKNEYAEFITLINQNPSLVEISNAALKKIISACDFVVGAFYSVDEGEIRLISSYGLKKRDSDYETNEFYQRVISTKEQIEITSEDLLPVIPTGTVKLWIKHLLIIPIIYNNKVTAIIEFGSVDSPSDESREYLSKIKEQLAIGLTNAKALVQLESFINELKRLNEDYQKQNVQIKKQNETLVQLHKQLERRAEELETEKQRAEESTKLKSQFLASMSHELRTPMNSILGLTELIIEKSHLNGKNKERLEVVLKSGRRLMTLINDILDLSKIEAGKMEIREEDNLLEEILEEIYNTINPLTIEKGIGLEIVRVCNTRIIITTDRTRLSQVLINLMGNAVKFTEKGAVKLRVSQTENEMLRFDVIDTGIGIDDQAQKIIFEEFRQIDGSTTRKYGGTGLGLAICKRIIDMLGGTISVKSKLGEGSNFFFTIPLKFGQEKQNLASQNVNVEVLRKNRKNPILVIDDDAEIRYTIGQYLISKGYEVIFAEDGEIGLKLAKEKQPFAITLDVMLPHKDGWTVLKDLKEDPNTKEIPVILVSILGDKKIGYGLGAFEYFVKPISSEKLISAFNRLEGLANKQIQKIVIVDDDELEFEKFKLEFKNENIRIDYIQDSEFAFNKIAEIQPDLIILDLMMPKIDGVTLSYKLKSSPQTKHIPIIISTAKDLTQEEIKALNTVVENITVKSRGHQLDVLKIVRDRIKQQEEGIIIQNRKEEKAENHGTAESPVVIDEEEILEDYLGEVLIVDDDPDTLFTLNEMVQAANCKTHLARNGIECLKILDLIKPDLVLLDIMMPEMDGFQTLKNIRANGKNRDLVVYAVTAKAMSGDREIILKHGFNDYIPKPVNSAVITAKIEQHLSKLRSV
jgi:signal transduction histidine kinase/DNA-binding response OmpR family regulator/HAMP domain-containing protein